jgi:hypothetical protein
MILIHETIGSLPSIPNAGLLYCVSMRNTTAACLIQVRGKKMAFFDTL